MREKEKAQRGLGGGRMTTPAKQLSAPNYSTNQVIFKSHVSGPLDLAVAKIEEHLRLARFHYTQVNKHKRIKAELEHLIGGDL